MDGNILLWIQEYVRADWMTPFWKGITFLGEFGWFWILIVVILLINKKTRKVGIMALISLVVCSIVTLVILKPWIARTRPFYAVDGLIPLIAKPKDYSFPSGHTSVSFAVAWIIYFGLDKKYGIPALILAALVGLSRLYLGVHYPTDVLAGFLIATCISVLIFYRKKFLKNF